MSATNVSLKGGTLFNPVTLRRPQYPKERSMSRTEPLPHLLTIEQLADHLGVTVRHVRGQIAERRVPYIKVGRLVRFDPVEITR